MMNRTMLRAALTALAAGSLLAACGGGSSDNEYDPNAPQPQAVIPDSALVSGTAYAEYAKSLARSETALPVDISKINIAPTSESVDPIGL
jgi:uncharacterized lipoprotein YajG